jgi:hypothetical protein
VEPGYFEHEDNSWIAFLPSAVERGVGGERFEGLPRPPMLFGYVDAPVPGFHLSVANAALQAMTFADVQQSDAPLLAAGFKADVTVPTVFTHADGCYIAFTPTQTYIGHGRNHFMKPPVPQRLDVNSAVPARPGHAHFAVARTNGLAADAALPHALLDLGFQATVPGHLYTHGDGSWVAVQGTQLFQGVSEELLSNVPMPPPPGSVVKDTTRPPLPDATSWIYWQQNMAIGRLPILSGEHTDVLVLDAVGFVQMDNEWWHEDGSWVKLEGPLALGWKGYHLGELPYNNSRPGR